MTRFPLLALLALSLAGTPAAFAKESPADRQFQSLYEKEWKWRVESFGTVDEDSDNSAGNGHLPDVGPAAQAERLKVWTDVLHQLDTIDPAALSPDNRINLAVYRPQVENLAAEVRLRGYEMPFNSDSSFWSDLGFMARQQMRSVGDYDAYIARLDDVPRYFDQQIDNMRAGLARGFSVPRAVLDGRDVSIAAMAGLKDPTAANFYGPFKQLPAQIPAAEQQRLRAAAATAIGQRMVPAYARLLKFFREEYMPRARTTLAAEAMPDGKAYYRQQIREYTTLDLDPEQIHRIGLDEVARIQAEMDAIIRQVGFKAPSGEKVFPAFLQFLRTDPQFYATEPQRLLERAAWIAAVIYSS